MEYKLVSPLSTKQVEEWEEAYFGKGYDKKPVVSSSMGAVKGALSANWYEGDKPDIEHILPAEVVGLATKIYTAYAEAFTGAKAKQKN